MTVYNIMVKTTILTKRKENTYLKKKIHILQRVYNFFYSRLNSLGFTFVVRLGIILFKSMFL